MHHFKDVLFEDEVNFPSLPPESAVFKVNLVNYLQFIFKLPSYSLKRKTK